jgi:cell division protease FtsH
MKASQKQALRQRSTRGLVTGTIATGLLILQSMLVGTPALAQTEEREPLTYGELLEKIDAGEVTKIELDPAQQKALVQLDDQKQDEPPTRGDAIRAKPRINGKSPRQ